MFCGNITRMGVKLGLLLNNTTLNSMSNQRTKVPKAAKITPFYCRARGNQIKSLSTVHIDNIVWSWEEPPNIWLTVAKNAVVVGGVSCPAKSRHKPNLVPRAHVSYGQHQDTELWNNQFLEIKILDFRFHGE